MLHPTLAVLVLLLGFQQPGPAPGPAPAPGSKRYDLGRRVQEIVLPDLDGKDHALLAENRDRAVALVFWSYRDPVSRAYVPVLARLQAQHAERLAVVLVDANQDEIVGANEPLARMAEILRKERVTLPVLIDHGNRVADDFGAVANSQVFLLDANHTLRYRGGIDDDPRGVKKARGEPVQAQLGAALDFVLAGTRPEVEWTIPAGRPIKRASRGAPPRAAGPEPR